MPIGSKKDCIRSLNFGNQVAEEEKDALKEYFVKTHAWDRIINGEVDIIYGPKGSGKSALYVLIQDNVDQLFDRKILLITAENPQGAPAFKDVERDPPSSEREFVAIWKLYFVSLLGRIIRDFAFRSEQGDKLCDALETSNLLPSKKTTLGSILASVRRYASQMIRPPRELHGEIKIEPSSGMPVGVAGKIVFHDPDMTQQKAGIYSVDELLSLANEALSRAKFNAWLMIDRLDVAFDESSELERNALRALFRAYRDMKGLECITPKIFMRTDIWKRITEDGFREATHLSRDIHLTWDKGALKNMIVRRLVSNPSIVELYAVDPTETLSSVAKQEELFNAIFPDQVEVGEKQSNTLDWLLRRAADGTHTTQPRDVILFLNQLTEVQNRRLEQGEAEPAGSLLFERISFKEAMPALSEYKVTKVIFAEYPKLRPFVDALRERKTEHNIESLATLWKVEENQAIGIAKALRDVGFFEERNKKGEITYWVPFVFRSYMQMSQGKVAELQGPGVDFGWLTQEELDDINMQLESAIKNNEPRESAR